MWNTISFIYLAKQKKKKSYTVKNNASGWYDGSIKYCNITVYDFSCILMKVYI